jgi:tRNA uridine 5-carbamoylmethylation protein Kti12
MIKVLAIGGEPCSGKTTLIKRFIRESGMKFEKVKAAKLLDALYCKESNLYIFGIYDDSTDVFQGTDKLSMAVQPSAVEFLEGLSEGTVIFEGDRLFNSKFLGCISEKVHPDNFRILILKAGQEVLNERHISRKDDQDDKFKNSRKTKISNIQANLDLREYMTSLPNNTSEDQEKLLGILKEFCLTV